MPSKSSKLSPETRKEQFPASNAIFERPELGKAEPSITWSVDGKQTDSSEEQSRRAYGSIWVSFDPGSNVSDDNAEHPAKQPSQRISTPAGMQISSSETQSKSASAPIRLNFDPGSNANDENESHPEKQALPRISISRFNTRLVSDPKYRISVILSQSSRKSPEIRK
jgi:hypothetical protein